ncbi:hypothetical protein VTK56DRAFT_4908 [Thermocarpiscus australiensis]
MTAMAPNQLRSFLARRSLRAALGEYFNNSITAELEQEFEYDYGKASDWHREVVTLLPSLVNTGLLSKATKRAVFRRVVIRDPGALTRFFMALIKSPECAAMVEELHCYVDLGNPTSAARLDQDITLVSSISEHLDRCEISLGLLTCMRDQLEIELTDQPYQPQLDVRFRQAIFLSLLGHLPSLRTLRLTVHGQAVRTLAWLRCAVQRHYSRPFDDPEPCRHPCPSLKKLTFHAVDSYQPTDLWHPFALWTLIDHPSLEELEIDNSQLTATRLSNQELTNTSNSTLLLDEDDNSDDESDIYDAFAHLRTLRIKSLLPLTQSYTLQRILLATRTLETLEICGSAPDLFLNTRPRDTTVSSSSSTTNLNTLLALPTIASTLRHLALDDICPTAQAATALYGPAQRLTGGCLALLTELRALSIPSFALFGGVFAAAAEKKWPRGGRQRRSTQRQQQQEEEGRFLLPVGVKFPVDMDSFAETTVCLPCRLERLEIREDPHGGTRWWAGEEEEMPVAVVGSPGKMTGLMRNFAEACARGFYPALRHVVLWCQRWGDERYDWSEGEQREVKEVFRKAGVEFEYLPFVPWPEGKVGGWRMFPGRGRGDHESQESRGYND